MVQMIVTMISVLMATGAMLVIAVGLAEDWPAVRRALGLRRAVVATGLPPRTRQIAGERRARIVQISPESSATRAAA